MCKHNCEIQTIRVIPRNPGYLRKSILNKHLPITSSFYLSNVKTGVRGRIFKGLLNGIDCNTAKVITLECEQQLSVQLFKRYGIKPQNMIIAESNQETHEHHMNRYVSDNNGWPFPHHEKVANVINRLTTTYDVGNLDLMCSMGDDLVASVKAFVAKANNCARLSITFTSRLCGGDKKYRNAYHSMFCIIQTIQASGRDVNIVDIIRYKSKDIKTNTHKGSNMIVMVLELDSDQVNGIVEYKYTKNPNGHSSFEKYDIGKITSPTCRVSRKELWKHMCCA